ncbi:MAG: styrene monooxygenase/indole monooxygenase family protein [Thermoleophilaceae bacterium]
MGSVGIVGSGIAGMHLALYLQQNEVPVTIYTDRSADQVAAGRLPNTVIHHRHTLEHEDLLGVDHWAGLDIGFHSAHVHLGGPDPLVMRGDFDYRPRSIDYRIYLPQLMCDFEERGGELVVREGLQAEDVDRLASEHDLLVVSSGKGSLGAMFAQRADKCPFEKPQRRLAAGLFHGVERAEPQGYTFSVSPGHGECVEFPTYSIEGEVTALLMENIPGGDLEVLAGTRYEDDPDGFDRLFLEKIRAHHPAVYERIDPAQFGLTRPQDLIQGALVPTVRQDYVRLSNGTYAVAVGDVHTTLDPVMGQGANSASFSAMALGRAIVEELAWDARFCERVVADRDRFVMGASDFTNIMLEPPAPHILELFGAMAECKPLLDEFTNNFSHPDRQVDALLTPERSRSLIARHRVDAPASSG